MSTKSKNQSKPSPIEKGNLGTVQWSVWRNERQDGQPFFKANIQNSYRDGDDWVATDGYSKWQCIKLAQAALSAYAALEKLERAHQPRAGEQAESILLEDDELPY